MVMMMLALAAQDLGTHEQADEKEYTMERVVGRILEKLAPEKAGEYLDEKSAAAARAALAAAQEELKRGTAYREALRKAIEGLDPGARKALVKDRDLKLYAGQRLRVLEFRHEYIKEARDIAKSRQQQRAIREVQKLLWP